MVLIKSMYQEDSSRETEMLTNGATVPEELKMQTMEMFDQQSSSHRPSENPQSAFFRFMGKCIYRYPAISIALSFLTATLSSLGILQMELQGKLYSRICFRPEV